MFVLLCLCLCLSYYFVFCCPTAWTNIFIYITFGIWCDRLLLSNLLGQPLHIKVLYAVKTSAVNHAFITTIVKIHKIEAESLTLSASPNFLQILAFCSSDMSSPLTITSNNCYNQKCIRKNDWIVLLIGKWWFTW